MEMNAHAVSTPPFKQSGRQGEDEPRDLVSPLLFWTLLDDKQKS